VTSRIAASALVARKVAKMKLTVVFVLNDGCADGKTCPTLADTDQETCVVVGKVLTDPEALGALGIGSDEMAVEVPASLLGR
jgi:hypothetical protein